MVAVLVEKAVRLSSLCRERAGLAAERRPPFVDRDVEAERT
jgi:hypothetical protein